MKLILITILFLTAGCTSVNVKQEFPAPPENASTCEELTITPYTENLSEVVLVVSENYGKYHICKATVEKWYEWYYLQKKTYDSVK